MALRLPVLSALLAPLFALVATPVAAQEHVIVTEEWIEVDTSLHTAGPHTAGRYVSPQQAAAETGAIAAFGAFRVLDENTAALVGITTDRSPANFARVLAAYPEIDTLEFIEAPGTHDDRANLQLGRMIRENGIVTRAPEGGSIRSGAVELFVAGVRREIDENSEFAVHGWLDDRGMGAEDYPMSAPEHRRYLDYYAEMGMGEAEASAFYAMTNSVPFEDAMWLTGREMRGWIEAGGDTQLAAEPEIREKADAESAAPRLAYLDLGPALQ
ncbi:hypothetical protein AAV99_02425 [Aurantiacibacter marinus]|uniref:Alpha/beta hydrolase n=2 Tax=Aurantiacibacter marinus TaxID=874156 RepID=A0A0H0XRA8_9SPHN|nr:hypothetical protein AAV99_02425 [Aurantiacibacter marinus]